MSKLLNFRVPQVIKDAVEEGGSRMILEHLISDEFRCPVCKKKISKAPIDWKPNFTVRVSDEIDQRVRKIEKYGHWLTVLLADKMGFCPVCFQKK